MIDYTAIAEVYDELYGAEQRRKNLVAKTFLDGTPTVIDVGCGTGILGELLEDIEYYLCVDSSEGMLRVFKKKEIAAPHDALLAEAEHLPLRDSSFGGAACITVIHEAPGALSEILRVTRKGGTAVVSVRRRLGTPVDLSCFSVEKVVESGGDEIYVLRVRSDKCLHITSSE